MSEVIRRHPYVSALFVLWAMALVSWATYRTFSDVPPNIPLSTAGALATVYGLPALAVGLWKWRNTPKSNGGGE